MGCVWSKRMSTDIIEGNRPRRRHPSRRSANATHATEEREWSNDSLLTTDTLSERSDIEKITDPKDLDERAETLQTHMSVDIKFQLSDADFTTVRQLATPYLSAHVLLSCRDFAELFQQMIIGGHCFLGQYAKVKEMLKQAHRKDLRGLVKNTEEEVRKLQERKRDLLLKENSKSFQTDCIERVEKTVPTKLLRQARKIIGNVVSLVVYGEKGDGKSFVLDSLAADPLPGYIPFGCQNADEAMQHVDSMSGSDLRVMFFMDNAFETTSVDSIRMWDNENFSISSDKHKFVFSMSTAIFDKYVYNEREENNFFSKVIQATPDNMVEVLTGKLVNEEYKYVFQDAHVKYEQFQNAWCHFLQSSPGQLSVIRDRKSVLSPCLLDFVQRSGAKILLDYLRDSAKIPCNCWRVDPHALPHNM